MVTLYLAEGVLTEMTGTVSRWYRREAGERSQLSVVSSQ